MVLNFHLFLSFIYWVGAGYALYAYNSVLKIPLIIPFLILIYVFLLIILGSHHLFMEVLLFIKGKKLEGNIVDYTKKNKLYTPQIRFRVKDVYETFPYYRSYFDKQDFKQVQIHYYKGLWTCEELAYLEI